MNLKSGSFLGLACTIFGGGLTFAEEIIINGYCINNTAPEERFIYWDYLEEREISPDFIIEFDPNLSKEAAIENEAEISPIPFNGHMSITKNSTRDEETVVKNLQISIDSCDLIEQPNGLSLLSDSGNRHCRLPFQAPRYIPLESGVVASGTWIDCDVNAVRKNCRNYDITSDNWRLMVRFNEGYMTNWSNIKMEMRNYFDQYLEPC